MKNSLPRLLPLTATAGFFALTGTVVSVLATIHEISQFAPGESVRFLMDGAIAATITVLLTLSFGLGGICLERQVLYNAMFLCIALAAFPLSSYCLVHMAAARGVILAP
jgi:hypothetical protein